MIDKETEQLTKKIITEMLTESTGKALMDSGDIYGRHWEKNQQNGILTGATKIDFYIDENDKTCELIPIIPISDIFNSYLKYTKDCIDLEKQIIDYNNSPYEQLLDIQESIGKNNIYENKRMRKDIHNTYNEDNFLNQDYQYIYFSNELTDYIGISIHNGCDIRGGYTDVHIFEVTDIDNFHTHHYTTYTGCLDGDTICSYGYCIEGFNIYYSYKEQEYVDEKYVYEHTYEDENKKLRCKHCQGYIVANSLAY